MDFKRDGACGKFLKKRETAFNKFDEARNVEFLKDMEAHFRKEADYLENQGDIVRSSDGLSLNIATYRTDFLGLTEDEKSRLRSGEYLKKGNYAGCNVKMNDKDEVNIESILLLAKTEFSVVDVFNAVQGINFGNRIHVARHSQNLDPELESWHFIYLNTSLQTSLPMTEVMDLLRLHASLGCKIIDILTTLDEDNFDFGTISKKIRLSLGKTDPNTLLALGESRIVPKFDITDNLLRRFEEGTLKSRRLDEVAIAIEENINPAGYNIQMSTIVKVANGNSLITFYTRISSELPKQMDMKTVFQLFLGQGKVYLSNESFEVSHDGKLGFTTFLYVDINTTDFSAIAFGKYEDLMGFIEYQLDVIYRE